MAAASSEAPALEETTDKPLAAPADVAAFVAAVVPMLAGCAAPAFAAFVEGKEHADVLGSFVGDGGVRTLVVTVRPGGRGRRNSPP